MARRSRGARRPEALLHKCPTCAAPPMEWCWAVVEGDEEHYPEGRPCGDHKPGKVFVNVPSSFLHAERKALRRRPGQRAVRTSKTKSQMIVDRLYPLVYLISYGAKKIEVIKALRGALMGLGLKEAKRLVESAPAPITKNISRHHAEQIVGQLVAAGATAEIREEKADE